MTKQEANLLYLKACRKVNHIEESQAICYEVAGGAIVRMRDFIAADKVRMRLFNYYKSKL